MSKLSAARHEICPDKFYPTFDHNQKNFRCICSFISNLNNRIESNPISLLAIFKRMRVTGIIVDDWAAAKDESIIMKRWQVVRYIQHKVKYSQKLIYLKWIWSYVCVCVCLIGQYEWLKHRTNMKDYWYPHKTSTIKRHYNPSVASGKENEDERKREMAMLLMRAQSNRFASLYIFFF